MDPPEFMLTRYLYSKTEVYQSLLLSLLEHKPKEALFWTYEIYYSGFQTDLFEYVVQIYNEVYSFENPKLSKFIEKSVQEWYDTPEKHYLIGSIIYTLAMRNYNLDEFVTKFFEVTCLPREEGRQINKRNFIVNLTPEDITQFETLIHPKPYLVLSQVGLYPIRKNANELFNTIVLDNVKEIYKFVDTWLYYTSKTPIWQERISAYGGAVDVENQKVSFEDDKKEGEFYDTWDYEVDEQSEEIKQRIYDHDPPQITMKDFAMLYDVNIIVKKVKLNIPTATVATPSETLTNSIMYNDTS